MPESDSFLEGHGSSPKDKYWFVKIFTPGCKEADVFYTLSEPVVDEEGDFVSFVDAESGEKVACINGVSVMFGEATVEQGEKPIPPDANCHVVIYLPTGSGERIDFYMRDLPWWVGRNHVICENIATGAQIVLTGCFKMICRSMTSSAYQAEDALLRQLFAGNDIEEHRGGEL